MSKTALILGINGMDGSHLADLLLEKGYEVHGMVRRSSTNNLERIEHIKNDVHLHEGDLLDPLSLRFVVDYVQADEIYNEADQDNVPWSLKTPGYSSDVTSGAVAKLLDIVWMVQGNHVKFFQPLSATMFGNAPSPQNEESTFNPRSPYAVAKCAAYYWCQYYREVKGLWVSTASMYQHTSRRQSEEYLLPKICNSVKRMAEGEQKELLLGNLDQRVDVGYSPEYMEAAWSILQSNEPDDFVIGTGQSYTIGEYVQQARFNVPGFFSMSRVKPDPQYYREDISTEVELVSNITKAKRVFGFDPQYHGTKLVEELLK